MFMHSFTCSISWFKGCLKIRSCWEILEKCAVAYLSKYRFCYPNKKTMLWHVDKMLQVYCCQRNVTCQHSALCHFFQHSVICQYNFRQQVSYANTCHISTQGHLDSETQQKFPWFFDSNKCIIYEKKKESTMPRLMNSKHALLLQLTTQFHHKSTNRLPPSSCSMNHEEF